MVTLRSIRRLRKEYPKIWVQLTEIWDPNDEYIRRFEETFSQQKSTPTTTPSNFVELDNRFGDSSKVEVADINVPSVKPYPPPDNISSSSTSTTTTTNKPSTTSTTTTAAPTTTTTKKYTTTPLIVTYGGGGGGFLPFPPPPNPVSFRPPSNLSVKGIVESIGSIGSQVIRAGTRIAGMLISSVQSVVGH